MHDQKTTGNAPHLKSRRTFFGACLAALFAPYMQAMAADAAPPATPSAVLLKTVHATDIDSYFSLKFTTLQLKNPATGKRETLTDLSALADGYAIFHGAIAPGDYEVEKIEHTGPGAFGLIPYLIISEMNTSRANAPALFKVKVEAGKLTNLGTWVLALGPGVDGKPALRIKVVDAPAGESMALEALTGVKPEAAASVGYSADAPAVQLASLPDEIAALADSSSLLSEPSRSPQGDIYMGGPLGTLYRRDAASGKWSRHASGGLERIVYVKALSASEVIGVVRPGSVLHWTDLAAPPVTVAVGEPREMVRAVVPMGAHGYAFLLMPAPLARDATKQSNRKQRIVWRTRLDVPDGEKQAHEFGTTALGKAPVVWDGEALQIYQPEVGFSRVSAVTRWEPQSGTRTETRLSTWALDVDTSSPQAWRMTRMNGTNVYAAVSADQGKTWTMNDIAAPDAWAIGPQNGGWGLKIIKRGWSTVSVRYALTKDAGKSWTEVGTPFDVKNVAGASFLVTTPEEILIRTSNSGLFRSNDGGKTFKPLPLGALQ